MCFLIYKIIPNKKIHFKTALQAALFTSLFWEVAKQLFGWYVCRLGRFSMVYGSLSTLAIFFLWIYYSSAILLLGGEVAFLIGEKERSHPMIEEKRRKTKIVCTIGPASESPQILEALIRGGMNVARLNFSHGTHEEHLRKIQTIRQIADRLKQPCRYPSGSWRPQNSDRPDERGRSRVKTRGKDFF